MLDLPGLCFVGYQMGDHHRETFQLLQHSILLVLGDCSSQCVMAGHCLWVGLTLSLRRDNHLGRSR